MSEAPIQTQDTKRRLAPQVSFKPDPSYENGKRNTSDTPRKTVIRFTREVLIAKRKPSSLMACMANLSDIVSENPADPVCFETLEPEDVIRIWNAAKVSHDGARGRGRSRLNRGDDEEGNVRGSEGKDLWDAEDSSAFDGKPFDFSKVAEESEKFRSELDNMKKSKHALSEDVQRMEEIDMDSLIVDSKPAEAKKPIQEESPEVSKVAKIEFGSILSGNSSAAVAAISTVVSSTNINSSAVQQGFDAPFAATAPATSSSSGSSLLSKIGVKLEPDGPIEWFYRDPSNMVQGPFCQANMRQWNKDGYFTPELPIQLAGWKKFHAFIEVFPDKKIAFEHVPSEPLTFLPISVVPADPAPVPEPTSAVTTAKSESVTKPVPQPSAPAHQSPQSHSSSHPQTQAKADVDRSNIAKKLLGISSEFTAQTAILPATEEKPKTFVQSKEIKKNNDQKQPAKPSNQHSQQVAADTSNSQAAATSEANQSNKQSKGWNKDSTVDSRSKPSGAANLLAIQEEQRVVTQQTAATAPVDSNSSAPTGAASLQLKSFLGINASKALGMNNGPKGWSNSGSANPAGNNPKSLHDIMSEELSQKQEVVASSGIAQVTARQQQASSHSWASKAAKPTNAPPTVVSTVLSRSSPTVSNSDTMPPPAPVASVSTGAAKASGRSNSNYSSDFGGKEMSAEMSDWCNAQLKKLNVAEDLSGVLGFCMSLKSPIEIRETLSSYLGSSAQVTNFATEFIRYKVDGKSPSSEFSGNASDAKRSTSQSAGSNFQQKKRVGK